MSGSILSSGNLIYNKDSPSFFHRLSNLKIKDLSIHIIPLTTNTSVNGLRYIWKILQPFIHPIFTPTLSHIAIQLNMEKNKDIIIMEYGPYYSTDTQMKDINILESANIFPSSNSFNQPINVNDDISFFFINRDGVRLRKIDIENFYPNDRMKEVNLSEKVKTIIAANHYRLTLSQLDKMGLMNNSQFEFYTIDCNIKNKLTLGELCDKFKSEKWEAKGYNVINHNCQDFAAKVVKYLKAVRKNRRDKIRMIEKYMMPNCLISALWDNEDLSFTNTIGRIPIIGLIHDYIVI